MAKARWYLWINNWREQDCALCGGTFRYRVRQRVRGEGVNNARAQSDAESKLTWQWKDVLAMRPCPHCGCYQPDIISRARTRVHLPVFLVALFLFMSVGGLYEIGLGVLSVFIGGAALMVIIWAIHFALLFWRPNRDLDSNFHKARSLSDAGELEAVAPPSGERKAPTGWLLHGTDRLQMLALATSLLLILVAAAPVLVPLTLSWPTSRETWPPAVGMGDTVEIPVQAFHRKGTTNGKWYGEVVARVESAEDPALVGQVWPATCVGSVAAPRHLGNGNRKDPKAAVAVVIPNDPALADQRITLSLELNLAWQELFERRKTSTTQQVTIRPARYPVATWHRWLIGIGIAGLVAFHVPLIYLWWRATRYRGLASPARLQPLDGSPLDEVPPAAAPADGIRPLGKVQRPAEG